MKVKLLIIAFCFSSSMIAFGQGYTTLGVGTSTPVGTLHIHSSEGIMPPVAPQVSGITPITPFDYQTILHVTNSYTGLGEARGFTIDQYNGSVTIHQYEQANISLVGPNGNGFTLTSLGNFGLGTSSPTARLHVNSNAIVQGTFTATSRSSIGSDCQVLTIGKAHTEGLSYGTAYIGFNAVRGGSSWTLQSGNTNNGGAVIWATIGGDILFSTIPSTNSGSSQIISDDTLRSHVNLKIGADGTLMAKEFKVTLTGWPDYVFDKSYNLMPLSETEQYIQAKGHLPNVPSAAEVEADGMSVGEMNKVLLQKVEELTLYVIELQKQIDELKNIKATSNN